MCIQRHLTSSHGAQQSSSTIKHTHPHTVATEEYGRVDPPSSPQLCDHQRCAKYRGAPQPIKASNVIAQGARESGVFIALKTSYRTRTRCQRHVRGNHCCCRAFFGSTHTNATEGPTHVELLRVVHSLVSRAAHSTVSAASDSCRGISRAHAWVATTAH